MGHTKKRHSRNRKNVKSADKVFRKQTLEPWNPWILSINLGYILTGHVNTRITAEMFVGCFAVEIFSPGIHMPLSALLFAFSVILNICHDTPPSVVEFLD